MDPKPAIPENENARLNALKRYEILDTPPETAYNDLVRLTSHVMGTPLAVISLVDSRRVWYKARIGLDIQETPRIVSICTHVIDNPQEILVIPDTLKDERFAENPFVTSNPGIRFYAGAPLITQDGYAIGSLCALDVKPRSITQEQVELLGILGRRVMTEMELRYEIIRLNKEIQARQNTEMILREKEQYLHQLTENIPEIFWILDLMDLKFVYVSPAYEKIWGRTRASLMEDGTSYVEAVYPEDLQEVEKYQANIGNNQEEQEFRIIRPDGQLRWVNARVFPIKDEEGRIYRVAGIVKDITERKQVELTASKLAAMVESSNDAILGVTWEGVITDWNRGAQILYGYSPQEAIGQNISMLYPPSRPDEFTYLIGEAGMGRTLKDFESERVARDGRIIPVSLSVFPIQTSDGKSIGAGSIARDITEHKNLERMKQDLTETLIHDLRGPVGNIQMVLSMLKTFGLSKKHGDLLEIAEVNTNRMFDLISSILDIGRLESGQMPISYQEINVRKFVEKNLNLQTLLARSKDIRLVNEVPESLPTLQADPGLIGRVIQNLLGNSIKFTPKGGVIRVTASVDKGDKMEVSITDTGMGIPLDIKSHIFDKYASDQTTGLGTGLGLVFCKLAVEAHLGRIWEESKPGEGTTFFFTLPLNQTRK